jgi:hypothetical protein
MADLGQIKSSENARPFCSLPLPSELRGTQLVNCQLHPNQ